jgi:carbon-monoxide dehydrogenase small subunit
MSETTLVTLTVNGEERSGQAQPRLLLSDFLRHTLGLTGTHVGCEHGVCGACTILVEDEPTRACLMFAVQAQGASVRTIEGLAAPGAELHPVQQAFHDTHAMQCGFCTPGFVLSLVSLLERDPGADDEELLDCVSGNLCRCTGYRNILTAAQLARDRMVDG